MHSPVGREPLGWPDAGIAGLGVASVIFVLIGEDTETTLFGLAFLGMVAVRILGMPGRALVVLAATTAAVVSVSLLGGFAHTGFGSTVAHLVISGMFAWGLSVPVWSRLEPGVAPGSRRAVVRLVAVVVLLGVCWEIGEYVGDRLLGTGLSVRFADIVLDLVADGVGALIGALAARRFNPLGREPASQPSSA
ncbi:MAG: hypothetical protein ACRDK9_00190 [Solirubrobacterales bacterium]